MNELHRYTRTTGEVVVIRLLGRGRHEYKLEVSVDGDLPRRYTTRCDPSDWARSYEAEDGPVAPYPPVPSGARKEAG